MTRARTKDSIRTQAWIVWAMALALASAVAPGPASAGSRKAEVPSQGLEEVSDAFEAGRALVGADRIAALDQASQSMAQVLRSGVDANQRAAASFLAGRIAYERGDYAAANEAFERALDAGEKGPYADDAAFSAIEAIEASGQDAQAMKAWTRWEKRFPQSSLIPAARLAQSWNALRRGAPDEAKKMLDALGRTSPWMTTNARYVRARSLALLMLDRPADALAALGTKMAGPEDTYLQALCYERQGSLLKAAAAYQMVAERSGDSPLRDPARLAKANTFLVAHDYRSAAEEFARVATQASDSGVVAEAELRAAGAVFLAGRTDSALTMLRSVVARYDGSDVAARGQFLIGEALVARGQSAEAIVELNRVLTRYFQHQVAASAQYRVARCLDALGRHADATGSYQAVVTGYPLEPEAPAAAYLAGVGLLRQNKPRSAATYFQLVCDKYAARRDSLGRVAFTRPEQQELVEAALCLLEYSYHQAGDLGQLSGAPHLLLTKMPESRSPWRAWAMLIDADASAAQGRFPEAQSTLDKLGRQFPDHPVGPAATKLLAWTYAREGRDSLAVATEERLLTRYGKSGREDLMSGAVLEIAHVRFNQKRYKEAAAAYEDFLRRYPGHPQRMRALYQAGLCYLRLERAGDAIDRWEAIVRDSADAVLAERAWARVGDVYFQAERYDDAKRAYTGLLEHFGGSSAAGIASLRLAQCEYNAGRDAAALAGFSQTIEKFPNTQYAREAARGTELALYRLTQRPDGAKVLARLVEQYPSSPFAADALFQIARRAYQEKRYAEAADGFRQVVSRFPGFSAADQAQFLMADAYTQAKSDADARQAYEQFLAFFPQSELAPTVHFRLGLMRFAAQEYSQAAVDFTSALNDSAAKTCDPPRGTTWRSVSGYSDRRTKRAQSSNGIVPSSRTTSAPRTWRSSSVI
jgi:TolA-binding protein